MRKRHLGLENKVEKSRRRKANPLFPAGVGVSRNQGGGLRLETGESKGTELRRRE